ncbi:MAG: hypothetical protein UV72_C0010G0018 [Candidatus Giovannonibacteria bacterium GW2011_GWB1_43_13]|nr:MAG: hypothetical protein UV72_C0010G0018 [Candidatus Giovannonibacteria bacterium GW2011_GWB1_43_13]
MVIQLTKLTPSDFNFHKVILTMATIAAMPLNYWACIYLPTAKTYAAIRYQFAPKVCFFVFQHNMTLLV